MFKYLLLTLIWIPMAQASFKVIHYNIKELDSVKIKTPGNNQINAVKKILSRFSSDIISLNEVQYDMLGIPNNDFKTKGENLSKLKSLIGADKLNYQSFHPANTGMNAKRKKDKTYFIEASEASARSHADQVNFGIFPAQYSTGVLTKYKIISEVIVSELKWKEFNANLDLSKFKQADGSDLPLDMELFDKNFSDITVEIEGKAVHIILLHTVPSYHFGNKYSVNDYRNAEQLRFLEWYLTGKTDHKVNLPSIQPLKSDAYFIAMGDFNVSVFDNGSEGSSVLKNLFKKSKLWMEAEKLSFTNESPGFDEKPLRLLLDYIVVSNNIKIKDAQIIHPKKMDLKAPDTEYKTFKTASDHYPIYGEFELQ